MDTTTPARSRSACELEDSPPGLQPPSPRYSLGQRFRSLYHALWFRLSERIHWSRKPYHEVPIGRPYRSRNLAVGLYRIPAGSLWSLLRIPLRTTHVPGETMPISICWTRPGRQRPGPFPTGGLVTDVGCANFWYAQTLHRFFQPAKLTGVDVEGFPTLSDRLQPLRRGRRIRRESSADLVCDRRLLRDGRTDGCHHGLVSVCHAGTRSSLAAPVNGVFSGTAPCPHRAQPLRREGPCSW
jgi:hypothetical protein